MYQRTKRVRHLLAALDMHKDRLCGYINQRKNRTEFLAFCWYLRDLYPPETRIAIVTDDFTLTCRRRRTSASASGPGRTTSSSVCHARVVGESPTQPTNASYLNRIESQFRAGATSH